jgi:hypothetical protein
MMDYQGIATMSNLRRRVGPLSGLVWFVLVCVGCGRAHGNLEGTLTIGGTPVTTGALITFIGADEEKVQAMVDESGHFKVENVPSGEVRVSIINSPLPPKNSVERPGLFTRDGRHLAGGRPEAVDRLAPTIGNQIPKRYEDSANGLTIEIRQGDNVIDIELTQSTSR